MEKYFSVGEAAKITDMTSETLRHYDRIGLVRPSRRDEWTNYRLYSKQDIVRLNTIHALQRMDLSLQEIKEVLDYNSLEQIVAFLEKAEKKADNKIAELQYCKEKIQSVKAEYVKKLQGQQGIGTVLKKDFPERVILLSETLEAPALENLWDYLRHFYNQLDPAERGYYTFEDMAGIYTKEGRSRLFAVCIRHAGSQKLITLPGGTYLCADCTEENRDAIQTELMRTAKTQYMAEPEFTVQQIVVSGILQWNYQVQIYLGNKLFTE